MRDDKVVVVLDTDASGPYKLWDVLWVSDRKLMKSFDSAEEAIEYASAINDTSVNVER